MSLSLVFSIVSMLISVIVFVLAKFIDNPLGAEFASSFSSALLSMSISLIVVNCYLSQRMKKSAIKALFMYVHSEIVDFHNAIIQKGYDKFGKGRFDEMFQAYVDANGNPNVISKDNCAFLSSLVTDKEIRTALSILDHTLFEATLLSSWSLNQRMLKLCLDIRTSMKDLKVILSESKPDDRKIAECILDIYLRTSELFGKMKRLAGIKD